MAAETTGKSSAIPKLKIQCEKEPIAVPRARTLFGKHFGKKNPDNRSLRKSKEGNVTNQ